MVKLSTPRPVKAVYTAISPAVGTVYQNTTGRPIIITVALRISASASAVDAFVYCDANPTPTTIVAEVSDNRSGTYAIIQTVSVIVPNNYYWELVQYIGTLQVAYAKQIEL